MIGNKIKIILQFDLNVVIVSYVMVPNILWLSVNDCLPCL